MAHKRDPDKKPLPGKEVIALLVTILVILILILAIYAATRGGNVLK
jgi:hypothetical protein